MTDNTQETDLKPATDKPIKTKKHKVKKSTTGRGIAWFALLLSLMAATASAYLWYRMLVADRLLDSNLADRATQAETRLDKLSASQTSLDQAQAALRQHQDTLTAAQGKFAKSLGKDRHDWTLEEAAQFLVVANTRVKLANDIDTAIVALRQADQRLGSLSDPKLLDLRKQIADEIDALKTVTRADIPGLSIQLGSLIASIDQLPLATRPHFVAPEPMPTETQTEQGPWQQAAKEFWSDFKGLVEVRRVEVTQPPLLPKEQRYFLRENLKLMLRGAQLALLSSEVNAYMDNLAQAANWIKAYYDLESETISKVLTDVAAMRDVTISPNIPDISGSLDKLRTLQQKGDKP